MQRSLTQGVRFLILMVFIGTLAACAMPPATQQDSCSRLWQEFNGRVAADSVQDSAGQPIDGFNYLRSDRFLASRMAQAESVAEQRFIAQQMRQQDLEARYRELLRLAPEDQQALSHWAPSQDLIALKATLSRCSAQQMREDFQDDGVYSRLQQAMTLQDDYRLWRRALGFYPLFVLPVAALAAGAHEEIQTQVAGFDEAVLPADILRLYRPQAKQPLSAKAIRAMVKSSRDNPAGLHNLSANDRERLAASFAPWIRQLCEQPSDLIGEISVTGALGEPASFQVNTDRPVVYYYFSETLLQGLPALQVNYVFWYPGRYSDASSWMERGHLDGITLRYTLDREGQPVMVDLINNCGCYYGMVPDARFFNLTTLQQPEKQAQILQPLPEMEERQRLLFTFSPRHLLLNARVHLEARETDLYELRPYEELELLPRPGGGFTSLFDEQGIVPGTRRIEAGLLFSMGIPSVGSMRQRGHQPITLVGREHFDDPLLFDGTFNYLEEAAPDDEFIRKHGSGLTRRVNTMKALSQGR